MVKYAQYSKFKTTVLILNLEIGFKKLMHIIYTQAPVHPCTLWAKKRKYDSGKKAQTDRQTVKYYLKQTLGLNKFTLIF